MRKQPMCPNQRCSGSRGGCPGREQSAKTLPEHLGEAELVSRFHCPGSLSLAPQTRDHFGTPSLDTAAFLDTPAIGVDQRKCARVLTQR